MALGDLAAALVGPGQALPTLTPESVRRRRLLAEKMLATGMDYSPIQSPWQGAARLAQGLLGGIEEGRLDKAEREGTASANASLASVLAGEYGGGAPAASASASAAPAAPMTGSGAAPSGPLPADRIKAAGDYFAGQGYQPHQVAGIVGNLMTESGLNPGALNPRDGRDGSNSIGVAQWNGSRAAALQQFAQANKLNPNDLTTQLAFVHQELQTTEKPTLQALQAAKNPAEAAAAFTGFERPAGWRPGAPEGAPTYGRRLGYANRVAAVLGGADPSAAGAPAPVQVASTDPNFAPGAQPTGLMAAGASVPLPPTRPPEFGPSAQTPPQPQQAPQAPAPAPQTPPDPTADNGNPVRPEMIAQAANHPQVQAAAQQAVQTPGGQQIARQAQTAPLAAIVSALSNPWLSDGQKSILLMVAKDKMAGQYGFQTLPDGTIIRTDSRRGTVEPIYQAPTKPVALGADQRLVDPNTGRVVAGPAGNYRPMSPDEKKAAGIDANFPAFLGPDGKPIFGNPGMNIVNQGESEESKVVGKATGERRVAVESAFQTAPEKLNKVALMRQLLGGIQSGRAAGVQSTLADVALGMGMSPQTVQSLGLDPKLPIASQALDMAVNQATLGSIGQGGFPANNFSDADRNFLTKVWPSIQNRPEANGIILSVHERAAQRQLEAADSWKQAQDQGKTFAQWEREWSHKIRGADLFSDVAQAAQGIGSPKAATNGQGKRLKFNPQTGQIE